MREHERALLEGPTISLHLTGKDFKVAKESKLTCTYLSQLGLSNVNRFVAFKYLGILGNVTLK